MRLVGTTYFFGEAHTHRNVFWRGALADVKKAIRQVIWPPGNPLKKFAIHPERGNASGMGNGVGPIKDRFLETLCDLGWHTFDRANPENFDAVKYRFEEHTKAADPISILELPNRIIRTLEGHDVRTIGQLLSLTRHELEDLRSIGNMAIREVDAGLSRLGMNLRSGFDYIGIEWETGNVSSAHRAVNRILRGNLPPQPLCIGGIVVAPTNRLARYLTDRVSNTEELLHYLPVWERLETIWPNLTLAMLAIEQDSDDPASPKIPKSTAGRALR